MGASPRVVLIDCYANAHLFVGDESFRTLAARLREEGVEVQLLDLVRDDPPSGKAIEDVVAAIRTAAPTLIVVSRAWSKDLLTLLRQAAGDDPTIVRHSHGAPSAIDPHFDAVVDIGGIRGLLAGSGDIALPTWRRTRRDLAKPGPSLAPSTAARPSITGPAVGCPFLIDVRTSPAYRDSGIDYDRVQTKGCSFCLDNVGAFAAFPAEVVVDTWVSQLRALRRERPEVREILLTDERPHPYLPALFREILADSTLHGIELLVKSRVDWLAEHADGALREACDLAEQSGSRVHLYLVGFESFHQSDLDLFNKAVTVADNVRAIEILHSLAARHPRSFEFRRLHMHGIVLFHPWTTPESLLENARVMRAVRFHELRRYALRTRLRLYASVPLHALAERQGLLVDQFDDGRIDRAIEQGYDASVPWRFADDRVEAIFRAANIVAGAMPDLHDADVLEMTTRFVLRWPAFAAAPDLAALPLLQAPFSWGASPADVVEIVGPALAGFDREVERVASGAKAACLKEAVARDDAANLIRAYETMGLAAAVVSTHARGGDDGRHGAGDSHAIVAVARDAATLARVVSHQRAVEENHLGDIAVMGELMGYPRCCTDAFAARPQRGDNLDLERAPLRAHPERPLAPLLNRFGAVSLLSHMLCAPDCAASLALADEILSVAKQVDATAPQRIVTHLATSVLRLDYRRAASLSGHWLDDRFLVESLRPFAHAEIGIDPELIRSIRVGPNGIVFELSTGHAHRVAGLAPVLVEPGQPLAAPVRRALEDAAALRASVEPAPAVAAPSVAAIATALAQRMQVGDHDIDATELDDVGGLHVTLSQGPRSIRVHIHPWDPTRPALSRRGRWALDLETGTELTDSTRKLVGELALLLPAGSHEGGPAVASG